MKDKRIKACPNPDCSKNKKHAKFKAEDTYCTECASRLVFVCAKCGRALEDRGPEHRICPVCEAKKADQRDRIIDAGQKVGGGLLAVGSLVIGALQKNKK